MLHGMQAAGFKHKDVFFFYQTGANILKYISKQK